MPDLSEKEKCLWAINQLQKKYDELGRIPQKSDFDSAALSRIKAFLGPWPRALEKAQLKEKSKTQKSNMPHKRKSRQKENY